MIEVNSISLSYGPIQILDRVSLAVQPGEIVGLVGRNGAGKSSLFDCICGLTKPDEGTVIVDAMPGRCPIGRTFQEPGIFKSLSPLDHALLGIETSQGRKLKSIRSRFGIDVANRRHALDLLSMFGLLDYADVPASQLSFGRRRKTDLVRAVATGALALVLDEPAGGLSRDEIDELPALLKLLARDHGCAILIADHHLEMVQQVSNHVLKLVDSHLIRASSAKP